VCGRLIVEPPAIRQAAHNRLYLEQLALVDNPRLSRQQARSMFYNLLFPPPEPTT
jgi:hypothetical protein